MRNEDKVGWIEDPRRLENVVDSFATQMNADHYHTRFYLQLRYARPTNVTTGSGGSVGMLQAPVFTDAFNSIIRQIGYNTFLEVTDACTAKICQRLRPRVIPVAAKPDIARSCTILNRLQDGVLDTCDFLSEATQAWEDTYCAPCGFVLFEEDEALGEIRCEHSDPLCWYWDRDEGRHPIHLYNREAVSREILIERYPDFEKEIRSAPQWRPPSIIGVDPPTANESDTVKVCRAWRRRVGERDGRYVVTVGKTVINGEPSARKDGGEAWPFDFFPVAVFRNRWDFRGFGGVPMGRFVTPHHMALNRLARIVEDSLKGAVPIISSHQDSGVNRLSDVPYQIMKWKGALEPKVIPTNPVSQQALDQINYHEMRAYAIAGVNKALASGQKPAGINSGVALREFIELAEARMSEYQKHWEAGWRQAGHIVVALAQQLKKVKVIGRDSANFEIFEELNIGDLKLDRNDYRISYGLTSALSKSVPGLLADLGEFKDLGLVDQIDMAEAVGDKVPDIQAAMDRVTAQRRLANKMIQDALETGKVIAPSARQGAEGLNAITYLGSQAWAQVMLSPDRYKPENVEALRRLIQAAEAKKPAKIPAPAAVRPGSPVSPDAIVPIGQPAGTAVAHNQYEAASLGILPSQPQE